MKKKKAIVIDLDDDEDSIMDDYDDYDGCGRFMVNAISENTSSVMSEKIDIPIICLDDDDDDLMIDDDYKVFLDDDNSLIPHYEVDNGKSETRKFDIHLSKRPKLENENLMKNRVDQRRKRKAIGYKADVKRSKIRENIQRDNRIAERRKRRSALCEAEKTSRIVPSIKTQQYSQRDNKVRKILELKAEALSSVPLVRTQEDTERVTIVSEGRKRQVDESKAAALRTVPLVRTQEDSQRDNIVSEGRKRQVDETTSAALRAVTLFRTQEDTERENIVSEGRKRQVGESKAEGLRAVPLVRTQEDTERDNIVSEGRKRQVDESKTAALRTIPFLRTQDETERENIVSEGRKRQVGESKVGASRAVALVRTQKDSQRDKTVWKVSGLKAEALRTVPLIRIQEDSQLDNTNFEGRKRQADELKTEALRAVPLVGTQEDSQLDNVVSEGKKRQADELKAGALRAVPLVRTQEDSERDNIVSEGRKRQADELNSGALSRAVPLVRNEEDVQRDNGIAERRRRKHSEAETAETSRFVHVERVSRVTEVKDVDETSRNKRAFAGRRNKNEKESAMFVDEDYMIYLKWLVDSLRDYVTKPMENLQSDPSNFDPPLLDSTIVPEKDVLLTPKVEQDLESWSDDSDIIAISDTPFMDGEGTPFVTSKKVIDLDEVRKEDETSGSWFRKELMDVLKEPYDERELNKLRLEVSIHRKLTRCRELRKGRQTNYESDELGQSYLESFPDFNEEYKLVDGVDKAKALELLRGFFFYLKYVSHDGAFKPWGKT